ncbi:hypothetical protein A0J61_07372 [Choanephora cucurbitarum]|uniref:Uncharacterized protein n=1 Tax=Choanephora cucurbitarum TaxID=101091 RepID=A0A1C7N600_9FUNG|nr:hypothetical protein A0J61_07372 [Choanephora cucurbitarum]
MLNQPPNNNNNNSFESDLEVIENAMNNMVQGAFAMLFREMTNGSGIFESVITDPHVTTIMDGRNLDHSHTHDDFGGSDFKRLASKSKQKQLTLESASNSIFDYLVPTKRLLFNRDSYENNNAAEGWSFSSTSQRTVYHPNGTQETILTRKVNGNTETTRRIQYPDGRTEETRENKSSIWNKLGWH